MNIQTERLENHTTRFTVEIDIARLDKAKKQAARVLSKRYNIPGFRKGKAPYHIIVNFLGEGAIIEDAVDTLGNEIYRDALKESDIEPYGPGSFEDFKLDPPTFIFTVPMQPEVDLKDYKSVRVDYEELEVTDEDFENTMRRLQQQEALVEESHKPVEAGNRVTIDIHSEFADGEEASEDDDSDTEADEDESSESEDEQNVPLKGDHFIHRHDAVINLDPEDEPVLPGFIKALEGANVDDTVEFELEIPDEEDYKDIVGRKVQFHVDIKKIEVVTLPEMNDDFAARLTQDEDEPLTLLDLRARIRENMVTEAKRQADSTYSDRVLDKIVEQAEISYPEDMVDDQIKHMLEDLDQRLRQQGMTLEDYKRITGKTDEDLSEDYHDSAENVLRRSLVLRELVTAENVAVSNDAIEEQLDAMAAQFGGQQGESFRRLLDTPQMRDNIINDLLQQKVLERIVQIGQGIEPQPEEEAAEETEAADAADEDPTVDEVDEPAEAEVETDTGSDVEEDDDPADS